MTRMTRRDFGLLTAGSLLAGGTVATAQAQQVLKVGLIPSEDSRAMLAQSKDILDAVEKNSGMKVQGFVATDYNGVIEALRAKHLDIAYLGPFSYVLATTVTPVEAFAIAETAKAGRTYYHSKIIALKSSGIKTLADLKGKNFAFVDPASTSGYAFPLAGLLKAGIEPKRDFKTVIFTGAHDANALAVANGKVDAATIADRILDAAIAKGHIKADQIQVVWESPPIPESPMVWRKDLSPETKAKVKAAFLSIKDLNWSDQGKLNGFKKPTTRPTTSCARPPSSRTSISRSRSSRNTSPGDRAMIEIRGLAKSYGDHQALHDVSLSIRPGEFVVVLGPSGAGKSTLLRCINRLIEPTAGDILVDGTSLSSNRRDLRLLRRNVAMIFQQHNLVKRLSVLKNVLVGRMADLSPILSSLQLFPEADVKIAMHCLEQVAMSHKARNRADALSGGEQQRVGIARALAQQPKFMLADEPVASLDPKTSRTVLNYLKKSCKESNIAVSATSIRSTMRWSSPSGRRPLGRPRRL